MLNFLRHLFSILATHQNHVRGYEKPTEAWAPLQTSGEGSSGVESSVNSFKSFQNNLNEQANLRAML